MTSGKERPPVPELNPEVVIAYAATFINRSDVYPFQQPDGHYIAVHKPLTLDLITRHLQGSITIGAYALDADSRAKWLCFDADSTEFWHTLLRLALDLETHGITPYRERSRRGGHLWFFFPTAVPGGFARRFGKQLLTEHNIPEKQVELYPKQDEHHTGEKALGSLVRLPLGRHRLDNQRYPFIDQNSHNLAPTLEQQITLFTNPIRIPFPVLMSVIARSPQPKLVQPRPTLHPNPEATGNTLSERIKASISVLDFVSQYIDLDRNHRGFCPFHNDQHMSFQIDDGRNFWHCYAGCTGQTVIDFWMNWRSTHGQDGSFTVTIKDLAQMLLSQ